METNPLAADLDHALARTEGLWEELRGGRLFVTGGTGFFGCWLLESFIWANKKLRLNASAVVLTRNIEAFRAKAPRLAANPAIQTLAGDYADFAFPSGSFTHAIHAASELSSPAPSDAPGMVEKMFLGARQVSAFARAAGVKKLLFTSSGAVYGPAVPGRRRLREEDGVSSIPLDPRGAYAEGKRAAELYLVLAGRDAGFETKIARGFAFIGPYLPMEGRLAAGNFVRDALRGGPVEVQGGGTAARSYLYGADLAVWLWTILFAGVDGRPYNLGSDAVMTVLELAQAVARECTPPAEVNILGRPGPSEVVDFYVPDISRARQELKLDVFIGFPEAIRRTLDWGRRQSSLTRAQKS
jgi:dTDP-glucose 4,6-dehydratase